MDGANPSQWLPGSRWGSSAANHRYQHHASEHDRTDSHADCALDIIDGNLTCGHFHLPGGTCHSCQNANTVQRQLSIGRGPTPESHTVHHIPSGPPGGLLKKPPGTEKESLFGSPPVGSGLPSGRAARAARSKKKGPSPARHERRWFDMSKKNFQTFLFPPSPARRYRSTVFSVVKFVSLVESNAIPISHFPHPISHLSPESTSLGVISRNLLRSVLSINKCQCRRDQFTVPSAVGAGRFREWTRRSDDDGGTPGPKIIIGPMDKPGKIARRTHFGKKRLDG